MARVLAQAMKDGSPSTDEATEQVRWAIRADHQTAGQGQHGRNWTDGAGRDLCLTAVLTSRPSLGAKKTRLADETAWTLNMKVCLAIADAIDSATEKSKSAPVGVVVKWPNDLFVAERKISGVLIENTWRGKEMSSAVIGIGLNIHGQPPYPNATSLEMAGCTPLDIDQMEKLVLTALAERLDGQQAHGALLKEYNARLLGQGMAQRWMLDGKEIRGVLDRIDLDGRMWLQGEKAGYAPGEVSWLGFEPDSSRRISHT